MAECMISLSGVQVSIKDDSLDGASCLKEAKEILYELISPAKDKAKAPRRSCTYEGNEYSHGSRKKMDGKPMKCNDGEWVEDKG